MSTITVDQMNEHAKAVAAKKEEYETAKKVSTALGKELDRLEDQMGKMLLELGQDSFKTPFGTMIMTERTSFKVPQNEEDRDAFFGQLKEMNVFDSMITVNSATMNAFLKAEYAAARARGEDMVTYKFAGIEPPTVSVTASLRKA